MTGGFARAPTDPPEDEGSLYQLVAERLEQAIVDGRLRGGDVLTEPVVADVIGTSRTPVRLAFEKLRQRGLLAKRTGQGYVVPGAEAGSEGRVERAALEAIIGQSAVERPAAAWTAIYPVIERELVFHSAYGELRIKETEVAAAFGVSRTVARDVLTRLERTGLAAKDERGRWFVVPLTRARIAHFYELRLLLEPHAVRTACPRIPPKDVEEMLARLRHVQDHYPDVSLDDLDLLEQDLHIRCLSFSPNPEILKVLRLVHPLLARNKHMMEAYLRVPAVDPFLAEHEAILTCLIDGDAVAAEDAMARHLRISCDRILLRFDGIEKSGQQALPPYLHWT